MSRYIDAEMTTRQTIKRLKNIIIRNGEQEDYCAIDTAIEALEKQIPKKPYIDNENGVYEKEYCPTCHRSLFPNDHHCRCGQALDWVKESEE